MVTSHGRATLLLWKTVASSTLKGNQRRYEYELLARLREVLPPGVKVTVLADRGFADCKLFYALATELGFDYVIRLRGDVYVTNARGERRLAADWVGAGGRARRLVGARVTDAHEFEVGAVVCVHDRKMDEPWCQYFRPMGDGRACNRRARGRQAGRARVGRPRDPEDSGGGGARAGAGDAGAGVHDERWATIRRRAPRGSMASMVVANRSRRLSGNRPVSRTAKASRRSCFFCRQTGRRLTNEHVWPKWVSGLLCGRSDSFTHYTRRVTATDDAMTPTGRSRYLNVTTRAVCRDCNSGWLSDLESQFKPLATRLIVGERTVALALSPESQALLAAWAYKMAMLLDVAHPSASREFYTPRDRLLFRSTSLAHGFVHVFLGRCAFGDRPALARKLRDTLPRRAYWELATMTAGHLAMQVLSVRSVASNELVPAGTLGVDFFGRARGTVSPIWPPVPAYLEWPPARTMSHRDVEDLAELDARSAVGGL